MSVALAENPRAVIGGNSPPPTPYEIAQKAVEDIYSEASMWLDGATVDSQELADGIANLLAELRKARKLAEDTRKVEKKPHDDAAAEVQHRYKPLFDKADLAAEACKKAVAPWLKKLADQIERKAAEARAEADRQQQAAQDALRAADATNLAERAKAEALVTAVKKANTVANKAERQTATAGGAHGRAMGLRTVLVTRMTDKSAAAKHYWASAREEMTDFLQGLAERDVRAGKREIPGFTVEVEQRAV